MDADHLSVRLATVADYVPMGSRLADIGTDHAYLPVNLAKRGKIAGGVAGEVVKGPFENAQHKLKKRDCPNYSAAGQRFRQLKPTITLIPLPFGAHLSRFSRRTALPELTD